MWKIGKMMVGGGDVFLKEFDLNGPIPKGGYIVGIKDRMLFKTLPPRADTWFSNVPMHIIENWWRIKDLFRQFYALQDAAAVLIYGGQYEPRGNKDSRRRHALADQLIEIMKDTVIPELEGIFK